MSWSRYITRRLLLQAAAIGVGWTLWASINGITWAVRDPANEPDHLRYTFANGIVGMALSALIFLLYEKVFARWRLPVFALAAAVVCYLGGIGLDVLSGLLAPAFGWTQTYAPSAAILFVYSGLHSGIVMGLFSLTYFIVDYWQKLYVQRERARSAELLSERARLQMLRYQLNPHFLFNALNSVRMMVVEDPTRARQMITELSEFLRHSVDGGVDCTIGEEIAAIENYVAIQRIRFERKLEVEIDVDTAASPIVVPSFLIHPLVENAVKYGMETSPMPLRVEVSVLRKGVELLIRVRNSGRLVPSRAGAGTGLSNTRQRLALAFPQRHVFRLEEELGWVTAEMRIQLVS